MPRITTIVTTAALALVTASALAGCSIIGDLLGPGSAVRDDEGQVVEEGDVDVFSLAIGDCFDDEGSAEEVTSVPIVPCDQPHDNEVFHEFEIADGEFPGDDAVSTEADEKCVAAFDAFAGIAYADSTLDVFSLRPTAAGWEQGDRLVQCAIYDPAQQVSGTLSNAAY